MSWFITTQIIKCLAKIWYYQHSTIWFTLFVYFTPLVKKYIIPVSTIYIPYKQTLYYRTYFVDWLGYSLCRVCYVYLTLTCQSLLYNLNIKIRDFPYRTLSVQVTSMNLIKFDHIHTSQHEADKSLSITIQFIYQYIIHKSI